MVPIRQARAASLASGAQNRKLILNSIENGSEEKLCKKLTNTKPDQHAVVRTLRRFQKIQEGYAAPHHVRSKDS